MDNPLDTIVPYNPVPAEENQEMSATELSMPQEDSPRPPWHQAPATAIQLLQSVVALLACILGAFWWFSMQYTDLKVNQAEVHKDIVSLQEGVKDLRTAQIEQSRQASQKEAAADKLIELILKSGEVIQNGKGR